MSPGRAPFLDRTGRSRDVGLLSAIMQERKVCFLTLDLRIVIFPISQTCESLCLSVSVCPCTVFVLIYIQ